MTIDVAHILEEDRRRRQSRIEQYDPIRGIGSPIKRFELKISPARGSVHLPAAMMEHPMVRGMWEAGSLRAYTDEADVAAALGQLSVLRCQYDFEFWCAAVAKIKSKEGQIIPFVLNKPQRKYLKHLEDQRLSGEPVRAIVLKHRQWGATTMSYTYIAWHQIELYKRRDAWMVGFDLDGAKDVMGRYDRIRDEYSLQTLEIKPYAGMQKTRIIPQRDCTVSVGTVKEPNAPSGRTPQFVHLFEIGKWPSNQKESAEKLVANVESMLVDEPGTVGIYESTMQGESGTYFKELCDQARRGEVAYDFLFVSWTDDPQYRLAPRSDAPLTSYEPEDVEQFVAEWGEYHEFLWHHGCTLEQINWYMRQQTKPGYIVEPWRLKEEFPTTPEEAFQVGQDRVIPSSYVEAARQTCKEPIARGELRGAAQTGPDAMQDIHFENTPRGKLKIWRRPHDTYAGLLGRYVGENERIKNRYVMASDVGPGQSSGADYHDTVVIDRAPLLFGGHPELAAEYHGHEDVDLYAWGMARLATWYDRAYWAIEINSLQSERRPEDRSSDHGLTVVDTIKDFYANLYHRKVYDATIGEETRKAGWHMNKQTKGLAVSALTAHLRGAKQLLEDSEAEQAYVERCHAATQEMDTFLSIKGKMRAADGKKDDRVDTRAIACRLMEKMGPVKVVASTDRRRRQMVGGATHI